MGDEIDRVTVHDEQLTLDGGSEMVQGVDEVFLANRPGGFPQVRIDNEKRDDPTIASSSGRLDRRQQCGVVEQPEVTSKPQDGWHRLTVGGHRPDRRTSDLYPGTVGPTPSVGHRRRTQGAA